MIKSVLLHLVLLLAPSVAYLAWVFFFRRRLVAAAGRWGLPEGPWVWLVLAGLVLVVASLVILGLTTGFEVDATYHPARYEDGQLIPGETE